MFWLIFALVLSLICNAFFGFVLYAVQSKLKKLGLIVDKKKYKNI